VTLLADAGGPEFAPVAKTTANKAGAYSFTVAPAQSTFYRVARKRMSSTPVLVGVKDLLAVSPAPGAVEAGSTVTFTDSLAPDAAGQMVDLEGENPGGVGFHLIAAAPVNAADEYSIPYTFYAAGSDIMRIKAAASSRREGSASAPFTIAVTRLPVGGLQAGAG
jgi:hypothetical protein